jgi:hypothetical protein
MASSRVGSITMPDNVGFGMDGVGDDGGGLVHLAEGEVVVAARDVDQHAVGALDESSPSGALSRGDLG